jgi:EAL domain-containing protein (putative c-di-GMP-specific phosphodiesterase class I)
MKLPVQELKIDQSFISRMATDEEISTIVRSTIDLGHNLGLQVVAEGVEDRAVWDMLRTLGCDDAQGYFMSRPLEAHALTAWIRGNAGKFACPNSPVNRLAAAAAPLAPQSSSKSSL